LFILSVTRASLKEKEMATNLEKWSVDYLPPMLRAGLFCLGASTLAAFFLEKQYGGGFPGELVMIVFWSIPFASTLALAVLVIGLVFSPFPRSLSYGLATLLGVVAGYFWERGVYTIFINPFFGVFSVPVFFAWAAGGIAGMVAVAGWRSRAGKGNLILEVLLAVLLTMLIGLGSKSLVGEIYQARHVNIVWIKWEPGPGELVLGRRVDEQLTSGELESIRAEGLGGHLEWKVTANQGDGLVSRMVIILQQPVLNPVELMVPEEQAVIYIQQSDGSFVMRPSDAPLLSRSLRLAPNSVMPEVTTGYLTIPQGTTTMGGINWSRE
jgi:hypothetical protein